MSANNDILTAALSYAARGWSVIPLHNMRPVPSRSGEQAKACSCGKADCSSPAKHPRTRNGLKDATTDPATIAGWWQTWPAANVGIVTGVAASIIVIDVDPRHGGNESLAALEAEHGALMPTLQAMTGGGGRHLIYKHPGGKLGNRANVRPGIDVRADGGYIVAPPSVHISGRAYSWRPGHTPDGLQPAPMPTWLRELLTERHNSGEQQQPTTERPVSRNGNDDELAQLLDHAGRYVAQAAGAAYGARNNTAFNLAGHLAAYVTDTGETLTECQIIDLIRPWNYKNSPPLDEAELVKAARSAMTNGTPRAAHVVHTAPRPNVRQPEPIKLKRLDPYKPFPVHLLPDVLARFVTETAAALGCDPAFVALPTLATTAAAIGTNRVIELKASWCEPAIIWAAVVARSGTLKSPAFDAATAPLKHAQIDALKEHDLAREQHERATLKYERALADWRKSKGGGEPPVKPEPPTARRFIVSDCTVEALAPILQGNPGGVLAARDELAGLVRGFNQYKSGGRGGDAAAWLEFWRAGTVIVDRKSSGPLHVPRAAVSVTGTIQPGTLADVLTNEHWESGLAARLLLARPPELLKRWTERTPAWATVQRYEQTIRDMLTLQPAGGEHGPEPVRLPLDEQARVAWPTWYDRHARRIQDAGSDREAAALAKLEAYAVRFALVFALVTSPAADTISREALTGGIGLADWFANEAGRIYGQIGETAEQRETRRLVELIGRKGGTVTPRELMRSCRQFASAAEAEAALAQLIQAGAGHWERPAPGTDGGKPSKRFVLAYSSPEETLVDAADVDDTPADTPENGGIVSVNTVNGPECEASESWGEV